MEPTSVAAISTGGLATDDDVFVDLPTSVISVLDAARPATLQATLISLEAMLRNPMPVTPSAPDTRLAASPAPAPVKVRRAPAKAPNSLNPSRWISARVLGPMTLIVVGLVAVMAWIG